MNDYLSLDILVSDAVSNAVTAIEKSSLSYLVNDKISNCVLVIDNSSK